MKMLVVGGILLIGLVMAAEKTLAVSPHVVVSQVQAGAVSGSSAATQELVTLYNNSNTRVDITNWCIENKSQTGFGCFEPAAGNERVYLQPLSHALLASSAFAGAYPETPGPPSHYYDVIYAVTSTGKITGSSDTLSLYSETDSLIDQVSWNDLNGGQVLVRKTVTDSGQLLDTDDTGDFSKTTTLIIPQSGVRYERTVIDVCPALDGIQEIIPAGYGYDEAGNCDLLSLDVCSNLSNIQLEPPVGMLSDESNNCYVDVCENISALQVSIPIGYHANGLQCLLLENRALLLNEILANVAGSDIDNEFIEIYNPHADRLDLAGYKLMIGKSFEKSYALSLFTPTSSIGAYEFLVIRDSDLGFSLLNTSSGVRIVAPSGVVVSESVYSEPADNMSWALIGTGWTYTNQPTPGAHNLPSTYVLGDDDTVSASTSLAPCVPGKYRHPITNRCRNIETDTNMLVACDADEYRNLETNRCRKVASLAASLTPCSAGYERNPETNRCRKVASSTSTLTPCQVGHERNPATNRCRKSSALTNTAGVSVSAKPQDNSLATNGLIVAAGVSVVGYGLYEWRSELLRGLRRLAQLISGR